MVSVVGIGIVTLLINLIDPDFFGSLKMGWEIAKPLLAALFLWLLFVSSLLVDEDPLDHYRVLTLQTLSKLRSLRQSLGQWKKRFALYAKWAIILFGGWVLIAILLWIVSLPQRPDEAPLLFILWSLLPLSLPFVGLVVLSGPLGYLLWDIMISVLSIPVRFGARKLGIHGMGSFLESLAVVMIGLARYYDLVSEDKGLTPEVQHGMTSFGRYFLDGGGVFCAALGGTLSLLAHFGFFRQFRREKAN
ncbi:MAG: hypothetical protein ABSF50_19580 [Burkholderiaceae bacterium]